MERADYDRIAARARALGEKWGIDHAVVPSVDEVAEMFTLRLTIATNAAIPLTSLVDVNDRDFEAIIRYALQQLVAQGRAALDRALIELAHKVTV